MPDWIVGSYLKQASLIIVDWFVAKCLLRCRGQVYVFWFFFKFLNCTVLRFWNRTFRFLLLEKENKTIQQVCLCFLTNYHYS